MLIPVRAIEDKEWVQQWAGNWCPLSCSYFGHQYTQTMAGYYGRGLHYAVFISRQEKRSAHLVKSDLAEFGNYLVDQTIKDTQFALGLADDLRRNADAILTVIKELKGTDFSRSDYQRFLDAYYAYVNPHVGLKRIVDFLPPQLLEALLPVLLEARVYAESVYTETEKFTVDFTDTIGERAGYPGRLVRCLVKDELEDYFEDGELPETEVLERRYAACALLFKDGVYELEASDVVDGIEAALHAQEVAGRIRGVAAYPGKIVGTARLVFDPSKVSDFRTGDVLVTGMTRPEFMPLIKKAGAVVTDAGGILCHAAIVARELKKPAVIGTECATKGLHDGDEVEVDADNGVVRVLKRK